MITLMVVADIDTVDYSKALGSVIVDLGLGNIAQSVGGSQGSDTLISIENVLGSDYADIFYSNESANNNFHGGVTDSTGGDTVDYSKRLDDSDDKINVNLVAGTAEITDAGSISANDTFINIENITGTAGNDTIIGNELKNTLLGGLGNDILEGGAGNDYLDGGTGSDYAYYSQATSGVNVDLGISTAQVIGADQGTDTLISIENVIGSTHADTFKGNNISSNIINGGMVLSTGLENSSDENDTVDYSTLNNINDKIIVDLNNTLTPNVSVSLNGIAQGSDTLINIEHVIGSAGNDTFIGNSDSNNFKGKDGDDLFIIKEASSAGEADIIDGGNNTVNGDTVDFSQLSDTSFHVDVDLALQKLFLKNSANATVRNDSVSNIENIIGTNNEDRIIGDSSSNTLIGNDGTDFIQGLDGNDYIEGGDNTDNSASSSVYETLDGGKGDDTIYGGAGNDFILGGAGDGEDTLYGGSGNDSIKGGAGIDLLYGEADDDILKGESGEDSLYGGLGNDELLGGSGNDLLYGDDSLNTNTGSGNDILEGGDGEDTLHGGYGNDSLDGGDENDALYGGFGDDLLAGGLGNDVIDGADGIDTVTYANSLTAVTVNLALNTASGEGNDTLNSIENAIGSVYDDTFISDFSKSNVFDGNEGSETNGDNISYAAIHVDAGDEENDKVVINLSTEVGEVNTTDGYFEADIYQDGAKTTTDKLINIENITGSAGNDTITAANDNNSIYGLAGNDLLSGGEGNDYIHGGIGSDTVSYEYLSTKAVSVNLELGTSFVDSSDSDTLISIENAIGGGSSDTITGSSSINVLEGAAGDDTFVSSLGNDLIYGGKIGADNHIVGDMIDYSNSLNVNNNLFVNLSSISNAPSSAQIRLDSDDSSVYTDSLYGIENISGTSNDDTITGNSNNNTLLGNTGEDTLQGGLGKDKLDGGDGNDVFLISDLDVGDTGGDEIIGGLGNDTLDYSGITGSTGVTVNLETGADVVIGSYTHEFSGIEHLIGSHQKDILRGNDSLNKIQGLGGDDLIYGQSGGDYLYGGSESDGSSSGADTIYGKEGDDYIYGGDGNDSLYGGDGKDVVFGEAGEDTLFSGIGDDTLYGGTGADTFIFEAADNKNDLIYGGDASNDTSINDLIDYTQAIKGMRVTLEDTAAGIATSQDQGINTIFGIEHVKGSNLEGDTLSGNSAVNTLYGQGSDDTLSGNDGADHLFGGDQNDVLYGNNVSGITDDGAADTLDGGSGNDTLYGGLGDDTLYGGSENDIFYATNDSDGADLIDGNSGLDTISYSALSDADNKIEVTLGNNGTTSTVKVFDDLGVYTGALNDDTISNIENITATSGDDTMTGNNLANVLNGRSGSDTVKYDYLSGAGIDVNLNENKATDANSIVDTLLSIENIVGSSYDDVFVTKEGTDNKIEAGEGSEINGDTIDYSSNGATKLVLDLSTVDGTGFSSAIISGTTASTDLLKDIENVIATENNDEVSGNSDKNTIKGLAGNDTLSGLAGNDSIDGGLGNDLINGGAGADTLKGDEGDDTFIGTSFDGDTIDGGNDSTNDRGSDTLDYSQISGSGIDIALNNDQITTVTIGAATHTIVNIENVIGTNQNDTITGDNEKNILNGLAGNDSISGNAGLDTIYGGAGSDELLGGLDNDVLYGDDSLHTALGSGNDILDGGYGADTLYGGYGDDTLIGGEGADKLLGGEGNDTADYSSSSTSVDANLEGILSRWRRQWS